MRHTCRNLYLNCRRSYRIGNRISGNREKVEESNHESSDNNSDTRSPNTNQLENTATTNPLPMDPNILAPTLVPAPDIRQMGIRDRITYVIDAAHRAGFTSLAYVFIH